MTLASRAQLRRRSGRLGTLAGTYAHTKKQATATEAQQNDPGLTGFRRAAELTDEADTDVRRL